MTEDEQLNQPYHMYSADNNAAANIRVKRADDTKKTCSLHMIADPLLFDFFKNKRRGQTVVSSFYQYWQEMTSSQLSLDFRFLVNSIIYVRVAAACME